MDMQTHLLELASSDKPLLRNNSIRTAYAVPMRTLCALVLLSSLFAPVALTQGSLTVPLTPVAHGFLKLRATVAGREGTFLFDSGSGISSLSPAFAASVGCHPWGQLTGFRMTGQRLDMTHCDKVAFTLSGRSLPASTVGVFDLAKFLPSEVGQIDGTIALDLFANQAFTFSYADHFIRLLDQPALSRETIGLHSMPIHVVRDAEGLALTVNLPVITPAGTAWFEMDSGNTSDLVLVNKSLAPLFPLPTDGLQDVSIDLEDGTAFRGGARVLDLILDGNLGSSFLSKHNVTIDLLHQTAWISTNAGNTGNTIR